MLRPLFVATLTGALLLTAVPLGEAQARGTKPTKKRSTSKRKSSQPKVAVHVVAAGDTLLKIAGQYGVTVPAIRAANRRRIKKDVIRPGQELKIPMPKRGAGETTKGRVVEHIILPGETLGAIAQRYGTTIRAIRARNGLPRKAVLQVGRKLQVLTRMPERTKRRFIYTIQPGDTFSGIAKNFGLTVKQLRGMNPRKDPRRLRIGHRLTVYTEGSGKRSASAGRVSEGRLVNGEQLPAGPGYFRRTPNRSWGTNYTISELLRAISYVKQRHRGAHDLAIEHISAKTGGPLKPHKSHQSGRDVDMGVYFQKQPSEGPKRFLKCNKHPVDFEKTWTLLYALVRDNDRQSPVTYIFWEYECQKKLYNWAKKKRKPKRLLRRMFQYPSGKRAMTGIVRHVNGHASHLHVRFKCPPGDKACI